MRVLIVDDETLIRKTMQAQIQSLGAVGAIDTYLAASPDEAQKILDQWVIDIAFVDLHLDSSGRRTGLDLIKQMCAVRPFMLVVAMTGNDDLKLVEEAFRAGAAEYLLKPFDAQAVGQVMRKAPVLHKLLKKNESLKSRSSKSSSERIELTTKSKAFQKVLDVAKKMRGTPHSILIRGESGAGKEVIAQYLWDQENDDSRPFIAVNCGAIPPSLAESELFGHKRGAFTGATEPRAGKFESASGGDLFLDELATLSLDLQAKMLRALSTGEIYPVGQDQPKHVVCRIITATNEPLEEMIQAKAFREDLYFRVKQFTLTVPPLRERSEDIMDLAYSFLKARGESSKKFSPAAEKLLLEYRWPGNVRELKSAVEVACVMADGSTIEVDDIKPHLLSGGTSAKSTQAAAASPSAELDLDAFEGRFNSAVLSFQEKLIDRALSKHGSEVAAAKFLGIPRSTLGDLRKRIRSAKELGLS